jgi:protein-tyrosine-phosphatase
MNANLDGERGLPGLSFPDDALKRLAEELAVQYAGVFSPETVGRYILESYTGLMRTAKFKTYLVTLTARFVKERLTALAQTMDAALKSVPEVLFVCVENAGRSQMAMALLNRVADGAIHVRSAGSAPAGSISEQVVTVMQEIGLDLGEQFPKPLTDDVVQAADVVVTMGCGDACPVYPGKRYIDWDLPDPSLLDLDGVRAVRDRIEQLVTELAGELTGSTPITE